MYVVHLINLRRQITYITMELQSIRCAAPPPAELGTAAVRLVCHRPRGRSLCLPTCSLLPTERKQCETSHVRRNHFSNGCPLGQRHFKFFINSALLSPGGFQFQFVRSHQRLISLGEFIYRRSRLRCPYVPYDSNLKWRINPETAPFDPYHNFPFTWTVWF